MTGFGNPGINFEGRQLSAFSRFGSLGHFNLQVGCIGQIGAGNPEPAGGHLLDGTAAPVAVIIGVISIRIFTAFTAVALAADAIHGNRQGFVGLFADGAIGHGTGFKSSHDGLGRFDLIQGNGGCRCFELKQAPDQSLPVILFIDQFRKRLPGRCIPGAYGLLQFGDAHWIVLVRLTVTPPFVLAARIQMAAGRNFDSRNGLLMSQLNFTGNQINIGAADARGRAAKIFFNQGFVQADTFENLSAAVTLQGGNAHFGHDF